VARNSILQKLHLTSKFAMKQIHHYSIQNVAKIILAADKWTSNII